MCESSLNVRKSYQRGLSRVVLRDRNRGRRAGFRSLGHHSDEIEE
jgi:hypothetical protein